MEYNHPSEIVKDINFGDDAKQRVINGVDKLTQAVKSTLGASGKCVIYEDARGKPVITKDGVTVAESVVLFDPVENIGATLIKEAARNTVKEAGDGTTTATVLAEALIKEVDRQGKGTSTREIKKGVNSGLKKINEYLGEISVNIEGGMLESVSSISCNNDTTLGKIIAEAYEKVGKDGVVLMEESKTDETYVDLVDGVQIECGLTSPHFITNTEKQKAELDNPLVLIVESQIENIRKIQGVLEHVIKNGKPLLIIGDADPQVVSALAMNKVKGNIKVNVIDAPMYGISKRDTLNDLALMTGAIVINEELGDDMDLIQPIHLGTCMRSVTSDGETIIQVEERSEEVDDLIKQVENQIKESSNPNLVVRYEKRLARLLAKVAIVKVGANSEVELKEKRDRVEDAICATKAAIKEGIVPGGGIALLNASESIKAKSVGEQVLLNAVKSPFRTILENAGIEDYEPPKTKGRGLNVVTGETVSMVNSGIVDPLLVTKSALRNAASVATTILSTDCVINNLRINEGNR